MREPLNVFNRRRDSCGFAVPKFFNQLECEAILAGLKSAVGTGDV